MLEEPQLPLAHQETVKPQAVPVSDPTQEDIPLKSHFQDYLDFESDCSGIFDSMDIKTAKHIIQKIQPWPNLNKTLKTLEFRQIALLQ